MSSHSLLTIAAILLVALVDGKTIGHDKVRPFPQPKPKTISDKAAIKFKPQLFIREGCHPYPAVQEDGAVSGGLKWSGSESGECEGSPLGSQIYARSTWYNDVWAIMYAWYFPKGRHMVSTAPFLRFFGNRHEWNFVSVWKDTPAGDNQTVLGVSMSGAIGWHKRTPPESKYLDGNSVKVEYYSNAIVASTAVKLSEESGEFQDLITWEQLPDAARNALVNTEWDTSPFTLTGAVMPLKGKWFNHFLSSAYPF